MLTLYGITIVLFGALGMALVVGGQRVSVDHLHGRKHTFRGLLDFDVSRGEIMHRVHAVR